MVRLTGDEIDFVQANGIDSVKKAAYHFVRTRLAVSKPKRVPKKGHPVFKALHAVGADSRESIEKNFSIPTTDKLRETDIDAVVENAMGWIRGELKASGKVQAKIEEF
ncbi:MAG: DUF4186 family protein [Candidatus Altiarchaeota archaeon]|nr:DUF4186 family protein [Candidatus Altiarchaeota archaeon]